MKELHETASSNIIEMLQKASVLRADYTMASLFQWMGYRQRVAQEMLKRNYNYGSDEQYESLKSTYEYCNEQIKQILAL